MEHLRQPQFEEQTLEQVPLIGLVEYDGGIFETFHQRNGYANLEELVDAAFCLPSHDRNSSPPINSKDHALSVVQEMLFFGPVFIICESDQI